MQFSPWCQVGSSAILSLLSRNFYFCHIHVETLTFSHLTWGSSCCCPSHPHFFPSWRFRNPNRRGLHSFLILHLSFFPQTGNHLQFFTRHLCWRLQRLSRFAFPLPMIKFIFELLEWNNDIWCRLFIYFSERSSSEG